MNITGLKIAVFVGTLVLAWVLIRVDHFVFKKIRTIHEGLYLRFFERIIAAVLLIGGVLLAFSAFGGFNSIWKTVLGGTAFASAVLIFAAQDSIKDILAGLMISIYKPSSSSEVVISDVNLRVNHALKQNGIEIPYEYINVVHKGDAVRETGEAL